MSLLSGIGLAFRDAVIVAVVCSAVAIAVNATVHPEGIPLIAKEAYDILVPCPETEGKAGKLKPTDPQLTEATTFIIDARDTEAFGTWHFGKATNVVFDYLEPMDPEVLKRLAKSIAASRARRVAVYGDGDNPDSGEQLAKLISGHGIKNVFFVVGGAPALTKHKAGRR